jgi:hypothetical protein
MTRTGMTRTGMTRTGVTRTGMTRTGMTRTGMTRIGMTRTGMTWTGMTRTGVTRTGMTRTGMTRTGMTRTGTTRTGMTRRTVMDQDPRLPACSTRCHRDALAGRRCDSDGTDADAPSADPASRSGPGGPCSSCCDSGRSHPGTGLARHPSHPSHPSRITLHRPSNQPSTSS